MRWEAVIFGPQDTPFEDGTFKLSLEFTEEYPNKPPTVKFVSRMFHPNVYADGSICLDILQVLQKFFESYICHLRTNGPQLMTFLPFSRQSSPCWTSRTLTVQRTLWQLNFTRRTGGNTRSVYTILWNRLNYALRIYRFLVLAILWRK